MVARDRLERVQMEVVFLDRDGVLLEEPPVFRDHAGRRLELRRHRVCSADPFPEASHPEQIVADGAATLTEVVQNARLDLLW